MKVLTAFVSLAALMAVSGPALAGDAAVGADTYKRKCKACHSTEAGKHSGGPSLFGIMGRKAASTDFKKYLGLKEMDFVWDATNLDAFLTYPKKFVGSKSMAIKVKNPEDRANLMAYMETLK